MRITRYLVGVVAVTATVAFGQTTSEGVDAFNRGDYARAVQILRPIAERWGVYDEAALFHMAAMYQQGLGVREDRMRACALFARAAFTGRSTTRLYLQEALEQLHRLQGAMTTEQRDECHLLAHLGFDHTFQPATFTLGPADWIGLDLARDTQALRVTISRDGKDTRRDVGVMMLPGTRFVPFEHTQLMTGADRRTPRHFIEYFMWFPSADGLWSLSWHLFEVVSDDLVSVAGASGHMLTRSAELPSSELTGELRRLVQLRVNDRGDAEWEVLGLYRDGGVIETDAERREVSELGRRRTEADAQVDWAHIHNVHDAPKLTYADADGCGNLFVYGWSADRTEAIAVRADREVLALSTTPRTFDIKAQDAIAIEVHVSERPRRRWPFCTDVFDPAEEDRRETWKVTGGTVTIELSPHGVRVHMPLAYRATIRISGAEFVSATGTRVRQIQPIVLTAIVGWMSG